MAGPGNILITVGADTVSAVRDLGKVNGALGDTMTTSEKMSAGLKKAFVPAAAALGALGVAGYGAAKAAMEDAASADHLAQTMKRVTGAHGPAIKAMEDYISATSLATGVSDDKLRPAMEKLITATGDQAKAQKLMNQVMDISAATGKDVDTVSTAVAKGYQGQTSSLAKLVPGLSEASRKSKDFTVIMDELADKTGGAASKAADTAAGKMARFQVSVSELQESIGYALLPVIEAVIPVMLKMADFASDNVTAIKLLAAAVGAVAAVIVTANVAMKVYEAAQVAIKVATTAWTAAQWLLNAALDANPIGAIVVALTALAAGLVLAYNRSETFRSIVKGALNAVEDAGRALAQAFEKVFDWAQHAFNWIIDHWKIGLFAFGPIGAAIFVLVTQWDKITAAARAAMDAATSALRTMASVFNAVADTIGGAADRIVSWIRRIWEAAQQAAGIVSDMANTIRHAVSSSIGWVDDLYGKLDGVIDKIRDVIGWLGKIHVPSLPGGIHIPTPWAFPASAPASLGRAGAPNARSSPAPVGGAVVINVYGALDPEGVARQIRRLLERHDRRQGWAVA